MAFVLMQKNVQGERNPNNTVLCSLLEYSESNIEFIMAKILRGKKET